MSMAVEGEFADRRAMNVDIDITYISDVCEAIAPQLLNWVSTRRV
jgi:hypothetical protein